ncbi:TRAP transporter small permease [Paracoccus sp. (in: a-proteobacteria)]|uniref:TRAP transporter small permease n=1 Tax=Paracoccus sp. TaxID=267 RepID=UPI003A8B3F49
MKILKPQWAGWLIVPLRLIAAASMFVMAALTFVDVVGRYFSAPVFGAAEMIQFLLAITIFAGLGLATVSGAHISVDILEPWFRHRLSRPHRILLWACNCAAGVLIAWQILRLGWHGVETGRRSIVLEWPEGWLILCCGVLAAVALILDLAGIRDEGDPGDTP